MEDISEHRLEHGDEPGNSYFAAGILVPNVSHAGGAAFERKAGLFTFSPPGR